MVNGHRQLARGFSLIELMIVLAIIGVSALLAAPLTGNWAASAQLRQSQELVGQGIARAKALAQRNPGAVTGRLPASILCLASGSLKLTVASDATHGASCNGTAHWTASLPGTPQVRVGTATFACIAFDNRALPLNPVAAGTGSDTCSTAMSLSFAKASSNVQITYY